MSDAKTSPSTLPRRKRRKKATTLSFDLDKFILDFFDENGAVAFHLDGNMLCDDAQQAVELLHIANVVERARLARREMKIKMPEEGLCLIFTSAKRGGMPADPAPLIKGWDDLPLDVKNIVLDYAKKGLHLGKPGSASRPSPPDTRGLARDVGSRTEKRIVVEGRRRQFRPNWASSL